MALAAGQRKNEREREELKRVQANCEKTLRGKNKRDEIMRK